MGKRRVIAETGAGQHGVATARHVLILVWIARFIWVKWMRTTSSNVSRMKFLGAKVETRISRNKNFKRCC